MSAVTLNPTYKDAWSSPFYSARYGQDKSFHFLEASFDIKVFYENAPYEEQSFLRRFQEATKNDSDISRILSNPLVKKMGLTFDWTRSGSAITATYVLPKAKHIHLMLDEVIGNSHYNLVEHSGAHITPDEYVGYIARGEFPLANSPSWQMIHDRLDHVIGALVIPQEQFEREREFAIKTITYALESNSFKTRSLVVTDFLDAMTYATTLSVVSNRLPTEKTYQNLVREFKDKKVDCKVPLIEIGQSPAKILDMLNDSFMRAVSATNCLL